MKTTTFPGKHSSLAATVPLRSHLEALRDADKLLEAERDRRYAEVNIEREKALKIKETADLAALGLAREIQDYKDGKADSQREQTSGERHLYATKTEITSLGDKFTTLLKPLSDYVTSQQGGTEVATEGRQRSQWLVGVLIALGVFAADFIAKKLP